MASSDQDTAVSDVGRPVPQPKAHDCLVVIYQRDGGGKCITLDRALLRIGRDPDNEIVLDDEGVSRRHARIEKRNGRLLLMDVGSKNGTLINDAEVSSLVELKTGDRIKVGSTIFKYLTASDLEASLHEQIFVSTTTDELTGLRSKRFLNDELARELSRARRYNRQLSLLMIDIDNFKAVNDQHGHQTGDITLRAIAETIVGCLRCDATAARFGGEEIVVLLPETRLDEAATVAERVRAAVATRVVSFRAVSLQVTVSIGCASYSHADKDDSVLFERADHMMYAAKEAGRNAVRY
jgi:diguanylate cyclase (GGDEF)-like protein